MYHVICILRSSNTSVFPLTPPPPPPTPTTTEADIVFSAAKDDEVGMEGSITSDDDVAVAGEDEDLLGLPGSGLPCGRFERR